MSNKPKLTRKDWFYIIATILLVNFIAIKAFYVLTNGGLY